MSNEISTFMNCPIGKRPTGKQDQGSEVDVTNYVDVKTGNGGKEAISTQMKNIFGKMPSGSKRDGI